MSPEENELYAALLTAVKTDQWDEADRLGALLDQIADERRQRLARPTALASSAAWYAAQGVPVFPVEPRGKVPLVRWRDEATTKPEQIAYWWRRWPNANIGMPTGIRWDVIDVDGPPGYQSHGLLREQGRLPERLGMAWTPRGGMHVYINVSGQGNAAGYMPGLDYRGLGGYVVLPPSWGANGRQYEWDTMPPVAP